MYEYTYTRIALARRVKLAQLDAHVFDSSISPRFPLKKCREGEGRLHDDEISNGIYISFARLVSKNIRFVNSYVPEIPSIFL